MTTAKKKILLEEVDAEDKQRGMTSAQQAYQYIIKGLEDGTLKPGTRIRETEFAKSVGLSRTPVREALNRLVNEGLVTNDPHRGMIITELDQALVGELYEMRAVLESTAASLAAKHATDVEISLLRTLMEADKDMTDPLEIASNNRLFHQVLYQCGHNRFLLKTLHALQNSMLLLGDSTLAERGRPEEAHDEHEAIVRALEARDHELAAESARKHIKEAYKTRLSRFLFEQ
ncbi:MAG: GntR family transcriptional regulator [Alcaligenaceae bacterium]|jgi:DNA-binding GntR family transcriptional regulator|nr:GntR family transcriptional regulator [Alcaligenaceae bacterium]NLB32114.1 GntR family transcriptional regulator [Alcaligenaceae bacterium]